MKDACFAAAGFFSVAAVFCLFTKILPVSSDTWLICVLLATICVLGGLFLFPPRRAHATGFRSEVIRGPGDTPETGELTVASSELEGNSIVPQYRDVFDEARIHQDLQSLSSQQGVLSQHFALRNKQRKRKKEIELVQQWTEFYNVGRDMLKSKTELLRARNEHWGLEREHEEKSAEKEANIAKFQADAAEHRQRGTRASIQQVEATPITKDERRQQEKERIERDIDRLQSDLVVAQGKTKSEEDRCRLENLYQNRIEELRQRLSDYL